MKYQWIIRNTTYRGDNFKLLTSKTYFTFKQVENMYNGWEIIRFDFV